MYEISPQHEFLVGIDSDGCAFDTMEVKHKECFIPNIIQHYKLAGVSKYAREAAEFVNLYSKSRGINRFPALIEALEWLKERPEVIARKIDVVIPQGVVEWMKRETKLGNPTLEVEVKKTSDPDLAQALKWSKAVNATVTDVVHNVPPFPYVRECLEKLAAKADLLVVSATPNEALEREWQEHDLTKYVRSICGQEIGSKKEILTNAKKFTQRQTRMIGDAPGAYNAAKANDALFYPINPGHEEASWKRLYDEGIERFFGGTFAGDYQTKLLAEFDQYLPELPPWKKS
jgi:phosphoglycolate phosphatase-like HAD superfamily hydrolase